jgi:hypothetical protein
MTSAVLGPRTAPTPQQDLTGLRGDEEEEKSGGEDGELSRSPPHLRIRQPPRTDHMRGKDLHRQQSHQPRERYSARGHPS